MNSSNESQKKLNVKGFAIHVKVKNYTSTCFFTQRCWLRIQHNQIDIHLGIYWWKALHKLGVILLYIREKNVKMLLNMTVKLKEDLPFVSKHLVSCFILLMSHFHIKVLISTADKQWKRKNETVPVDQLLSWLKCCTCLCTYRALMIRTTSNIGSKKKLTAVT